MLALTILLLLMAAMAVIVIAVLAASNMLALIPVVIPIVPLLLAVGSGLLGVLELPMLFGEKADRRAAVRDLKWMLGTCVVSAALWWLSSVAL